MTTTSENMASVFDQVITELTSKPNQMAWHRWKLVTRTRGRTFMACKLFMKPSATCMRKMAL